MPTVEDLGKKVKAKYPGQYDDLSDVDLGAKVKAKYPDAYKDFTDKKTPLFGLAKQAAQRKASIGVEQTKAGYEQDISAAKSKFVGDVAKTIPVAATLATGGLAAPLAIGALGAAGAASGVYEEAAKLALGTEDAAASPRQLARRLGVDAALGAGAQAAGMLTGKLLSAAGKNVIEPMVARAAAKMDQGKTVLGAYGVKLMNKIRSLEASASISPAPSSETALAFPGTAKTAGKIPVNIHKELLDLEARIAARGTGLSDAFKERWPGMATKIQAWDGSLSQLTEIKGDLSQMAFKKGGLNFEEQAALKEFAAGVDKKLTQKFSEIGGSRLYQGFKEVQNQLHRFNAGAELGGLALRHMAWRAGYLTAGAGIGGAEGYKHGGGWTGAVTGAVLGAATITAAEAAIQKGAPLLLEKMLADKAVAPVANRAITSMMNGNTKQAVAIMSRAAAQIGAKDILASYFKEQAEQEAPDAAQARKE